MDDSSGETFYFPPTPLTEVSLGMPFRVLVKDESACPTGTFKDRLGWELARRLRARTRGPETLVSSITYGNTAFSIHSGIEAAYESLPRPQEFAVFPMGFGNRQVGPDTSGSVIEGSKIIARLRRAGVICKEVDLAAGVMRATDIADLARGEGLEFTQHIDVSEGISEPCYAPILIEALGQASELGLDIDTIIAPVGAGVLYDAVASEAVERDLSVRVLGAAVVDPESIGDKIYALYSPYYRSLRDHGVAQSRIASEHQVFVVSDSEILDSIGLVGSTVNCEPSAAASFALLLRKKIMLGARVVLVINTGNGIPWAKGGER